jgi:transcriptional regulator with XRE-family HTH domain
MLDSPLAQARKAQGLTQFKLAVKAGCTPQWIHQLERGYRPSQSRVIESIARALNTPVEQLFPELER